MKRENKEKLAAALAEKERRESLREYKRYSKRNIKITNKKGRKVPLVQNNVQRKLDSLIKELRDSLVPPKIIILKSRQMGLSTDVQGRMFYETATKENRNAMIVSHQDSSTKAIFRKAKYMKDNLPEDVAPLIRNSNAREILFDKPLHYKGEETGLNSRIEIYTAGSDGISRGDTKHYVHISEFAFWPGNEQKSPISQLTAILNAVPDDMMDTFVIIESTANGFNDFKDMWDNAVAGENGFTPIFFPWYIHEEYIIPLGRNKRLQLERTMSKYEKWLLELLTKEAESDDSIGDPLERIAWWRKTKKEKCNNNINRMKQENPTTPDEAFIFSGTPVFDNEKVYQRIEYLRQKYKVQPYKEGYFSFEWGNYRYKDYIKLPSITFVESKSKPYVRIYREPEHSVPYVLGGDTKGEGKDKYTGTIIDNRNMRRCASLEMHDTTNSKPYTWQMFCLGVYYNTALIGIEMNFNTAPIEELERLAYPKQYHREKTDTYDKKPLKKLGWKTDKITRPMIIDDEVYLVENHIRLFNDIPTLKEMLTFVIDTDGRPDAMSGKHDDLLFSDMICSAIRGQQDFAVNSENRFNFEKLPPDLQEDYWNAPVATREHLLQRWGKEGLI